MANIQIRSIGQILELERKHQRKKKEFRFGDSLYWSDITYEIGTAAVEAIIPINDDIKLLEASWFSSSLQNRYCGEGLLELKAGDQIIHARAGMHTLAILDYRNPETQKPFYLDESYDDGDLRLHELKGPENNYVYFTVKEITVAIFRNPIILYHYTELR